MASDGGQSLEALWDAQSNTVQRLEELTTEFCRFSIEMKESQSLKLVSTLNPATKMERCFPLYANRWKFDGIRTDLRIPRILNTFIESEEAKEMRCRFEVSDSKEDESSHVGCHRDRNPNDFGIKMDMPFFDSHLHIEDYLD